MQSTMFGFGFAADGCLRIFDWPHYFSGISFGLKINKLIKSNWRTLVSPIKADCSAPLIPQHKAASGERGGHEQKHRRLMGSSRPLLKPPN